MMESDSTKDIESNEIDSIIERDPDLKKWEYNRLIITLKTVERFMHLGKDAPIAWMLYCFYFYKARKDKTNQPWATDNYCYNEKGLNWSKDKFHRIKKLLLDNHFIETVKKREKGKIIGHYIKVIGMPKSISHNPEKQGNGANHNPDFTTSGKKPPVVKPVTNALIKTTKMLKENNNNDSPSGSGCCRSDLIQKWEEKFGEKIPNHIKNEYKDVLKKCAYQMINQYDSDDIKKSPIGILRAMLFNHEDIPDIPKSNESELSPEDIKRIKRIEGLFKIKEAHYNDVEIQRMVGDFICVIKAGISQKEFEKRKDELNGMIDNKIKMGEAVDETVKSISESLTIIS